MIKTVISRSLIAALLLGGSGAAYSADLDNIIYGPSLPKTQPVEIGSGWYLRGDVGYNFDTSGSASSFLAWDFIAPPGTTAVPYSSSSFDSDVTWGLGAGYQFNNWLRGEALLTYMTGRFDGESFSTTVPCTSTGLLGEGCSTDGGADFTAYGVMANGYIDLGTYAGFTPYVGAGAGYTLVDYDNYIDTETCDLGACVGPPFASQVVVHQGEKDWRFTYALMAGVAYEFTRNLKIDVGYKYTNVDGGDMYLFDAASLADGASGVQGTDDGFDTHQIIASLRYSLW
ncbi:MAG: outer membrane beta-barrel protein [Pseudomonadota bacterium]